MALKYIDFSVDMYGTTAISTSTYQVVYTGDEASANVRFTVTDEPDLTGATAKAHFYFADSHHIERDLTLDGLVFNYTLVGTENDHAGIARTDIMITLGGATFTRAGYKFRVDTSLEASAPLVDYAVDTLDTLVDTTEDWLLQAQSDFGTAQAQRADEWVTDNDTRDDAFDAAQSSRSTTFNESEAARTSTFNTNETSRSNTFTTNENARQAAAEANQAQAATDHTTASADHSTAVADSSLASSDHATATTDHSTAVIDHSTASADHTAALADQEIVDGLQDQFDAVIANATVDSEVINARQGSATLSENLLSIKSELAEKATKTELQSVASGSPKGVYATLALLQAAYPTGNTNIYVVQTDGNWYYWSGSAWTPGGEYQVPLANASDVSIVNASLISTNVDAALSEIKDTPNESLVKAVIAGKETVPLTSATAKITVPLDVADPNFLDFEAKRDVTTSGTTMLYGYTIKAKNRFDSSKATINKYVDHLTGLLGTATNHFSSDYVDVAAGETVTFSAKTGLKYARFVFYTSANVYVIGYLSGAFVDKMTYIVPEGAAKMRVSSDTTQSPISTWQIEKGEVASAYQEYESSKTLTLKAPLKMRSIANLTADTLSANGNFISQIGQDTFDGTEGWSEHTHLTDYYVYFMSFAQVNGALTGTANSGVATSSDGAFPVFAALPTTQGINIASTGNLFLAIAKTKVDSQVGADVLVKFKAYLATYPIDFIFKKVSATTTQTVVSYPVVRPGSEFEIVADTDLTLSYNLFKNTENVSRNLVLREDLQLEAAGTIHTGGYLYTSFGGGAMVDGKEVYVLRTAQKHVTTIGNYGKTIAYIKDKFGEWTTKILELGVTGGELRDINLSLPYDGTTDVLLSATKFTGTGTEYTNWIFRLDKNLNLKTAEEMLGTEGFFGWGNTLIAPSGKMMRVVYDVDFSETGGGVKLAIRAADSNNYSLVTIFPRTATLPTETTIGYWGDKLVAVARQNAGYSIYSETLDLEGLTGWSAPVTLAFKAHAPQLPCYTPEGQPLLMTYSSQTPSTVDLSDPNWQHRDIAISATYDGVYWNYEKILAVNNHYGGYTSFVATGRNEYGLMYYDDYDSAQPNYKAGTDLFYKSVNLERELPDLPYFETLHKRI